MHIVVTTTLHHRGRQATSVDDFLYRGYDMSVFPYSDGTGNGFRKLVEEFVRDGKILARYVYLLEGGDVLRSINIYTSEEAYQELCNHPITISVKKAWADREWEESKTVERCAALVDVADLYRCKD